MSWLKKAATKAVNKACDAAFGTDDAPPQGVDEAEQIVRDAAKKQEGKL